MTDRSVSPQQLLTPYILYFAFASACFIYGGLILSGVLDGAVGEPPALGLPFPLVAVFGLLAVSSFGLALLVGRVYEPRRETAPRPFLQKLQIRLIVQAAFMESIAIFGLVGCFLGFTRVESLLFVGAGLLGLLTLFPGLQARLDELKSMLRRSSEAPPA